MPCGEEKITPNGIFLLKKLADSKKCIIFAASNRGNPMIKIIISSHLFTKKQKTMKKFFMIAAMMVAALTVNAQNEEGQITIQPKVGANFSTITKFDDTKMKVGLAVGVEAEYGVSENFGVAAGVLYSMQGCGIKDASEKYKFDYINIPIVAQYYPVKGLAIKAGVQPGFCVSAKAGSAKITNKKSFDFSIPVGLSYEISKFVIDARYNFGLTKVLDSSVKGKNSVIQVTLGYKFAL